MLNMVKMGNCGETVLRSCRLHFLVDGLLVLSDFRSKMVI